MLQGTPMMAHTLKVRGLLKIFDNKTMVLDGWKGNNAKELWYYLHWDKIKKFRRKYIQTTS